MSIFEHQVTAVVVQPSGRSVEIPGWKSYRITQDMLQPSDDFEMTAKFSHETWDLLRTDSEIGVYIDSTRILSGFIGSREKTGDKGSGTNITIQGRDKVGRLLDETSPVFKFGGLRLKDLVKKIAGIPGDGLFEGVVLDNSLNRFLLRNKRSRQVSETGSPLVDGILGTFRSIGRIATFSRETGQKISRPLIIEPGILNGRSVQRKVKPGSSRWQVLELFLKEARLLAWADADGKNLFVGLPNYEQPPMFSFFEPRENSDLSGQGNAKITIRETVDDRYSKITCIGSFGRGDKAISPLGVGKKRTRHRFSVYDNPENQVDGSGADFLRRKELIFTDNSIRDVDSLKERAEREQLQRDADAIEAIVDVPGHGQVYEGNIPTTYAVDSISFLEDESTETVGHFLITSCEFTKDRAGGERTQIRAVPRGTMLVL